MGLKATGLGSFHLVADVLDALGVQGVVDERAIVDEVAESLGVQAFVDDAVEVGADIGLFAIADGSDQEILEGLVTKDLAQDIKDRAAELVTLAGQLLEEALPDLALAGFMGNEVPEVAHLPLADSMDAAEALLDSIGVPRQVVVDHEVGALVEVDALPGGVGGEEDEDLGVVLERLLGLAAAFTRRAAMDGDDGILVSEADGQLVRQVIQRVALFGKDDELPAELVGIEHLREVQRFGKALPFGILAGPAELQGLLSGN